MNIENNIVENGKFGQFGGQFVPETLMVALKEVEDAFNSCFPTPEFQNELNNLFIDYVGRPTSLYFAERLTEFIGGPKIY